MPLLIALPVAIVSVSGLIAWWLWLRFCRHVFDKAGSAKAMSDAAVVATSFWRRGERREDVVRPDTCLASEGEGRPEARRVVEE